MRLGMRIPPHIDGSNDVADNFHGAFHASDEAFRGLVHEGILAHNHLHHGMVYATGEKWVIVKKSYPPARPTL